MKTDKTTHIADLKKDVLDFVQERGWGQYHQAKNLAIAIAGEAAELLDHFQWITLAESDQVMEKNRTNIAHELVDVLIALISLCNRYDIDLTEILLKKIDQIAQRYPVK